MQFDQPFLSPLIQFVIEIVNTLCWSRCICRLVVFRTQLDVQHCHHYTNHTQRNQVEVGESSGNETEVEERHQIASAHHVDDHRVTDNDNHAACDVQTIGDDLWYRREHNLNNFGTHRHSHDNGRNSDTHCLEDQRRNVDPGERT